MTNTLSASFSDDRIPLAYLITFRCHGTWLHGDERGSTDRFHNRYGDPFIAPNRQWTQHEFRSLRRAPVELDAARRGVIETSIRETCLLRGWSLLALNVRSNHVHVVVSATGSARRALSGLKANATHALRKAGCWNDEASPWSEGGSGRYLWTEGQVQRAIDYVIDGQGGPLSNFDADA